MVIKKMNDTIFEAMFRQAVVEMCEKENEELLNINKQEINCLFSPELEKRINKLLAKDRRNTLLTQLIRGTKKAAIIFSVIMSVIFGVMLTRAEIRAEVNAILEEWHERFTSFTYNSDDMKTESKDLNGLYPKYIPDGYFEYKTEEFKETKYLIFTNNEGQYLQFTYSPTFKSPQISLDNENQIIEEIMIDKLPATLIKAQDDESDNGILCVINGYNLSIRGKISIDEIIKIIKSIN